MQPPVTIIYFTDGRGLYIEGKERVEAAVRAAKDAGVFLAFVILDNPAMKDSILDIKVPLFRQTGKVSKRYILQLRSTTPVNKNKEEISKVASEFQV